jgi:hypothetical protein
MNVWDSCKGRSEAVHRELDQGGLVLSFNATFPDSAVRENVAICRKGADAARPSVDAMRSWDRAPCHNAEEIIPGY